MIALLRPFLGYAIVAGIVALAAGGGWLALKSHYTEQGYEAALAEVAKENREAADAAEKARARRRGCDADSGVYWNTATGQCERGHL